MVLELQQPPCDREVASIMTEAYILQMEKWKSGKNLVGYLRAQVNSFSSLPISRFLDVRHINTYLLHF